MECITRPQGEEVADLAGGWGDEPSILIFADRECDRVAAQAAAHGAGARVIGMERIDAALDRLSRQAAVDLVLIELEASGTDHKALVDWASRAAREGVAATVISMPKALIDDVYAQVDGTDVMLLCDPGVEERAIELSLALARRRHKLHDLNIEPDAERLRRLSEEVARIASTLAELSSSSRSIAFDGPRGTPIAGQTAVDANMIRAAIRVRRMRDQFFSGDLFADPAWDMLLDLLAARLEDGRVAVSSLCIAAAVPATTALRWIRTLTEHGLFVRKADPEDGRRIFIELSDPAANALLAYFHAVQQAGVRFG